MAARRSRSRDNLRDVRVAPSRSRDPDLAAAVADLDFLAAAERVGPSTDALLQLPVVETPARGRIELTPAQQSQPMQTTRPRRLAPPSVIFDRLYPRILQLMDAMIGYPDRRQQLRIIDRIHKLVEALETWTWLACAEHQIPNEEVAGEQSSGLFREVGMPEQEIFYSDPVEGQLPRSHVWPAGAEIINDADMESGP